MRGRLDIRRQEGMALILVILMLPVILLFGAFAVDVANWYVHKRHIQTKADAAALAGAGEMRAAILSSNCTPSAVANRAVEYGTTRNSSFGDSAAEGRTTVLVNQSNYKDQTTPSDTDLTGDPCTDRVVDVKVSEKDVPWFFGVPGKVPWINARARVDIRKIAVAGRSLPVAVEDPSAKAAAATFIDESNSSVIAAAALKRTGFTGGLEFWQTPTESPISFNVTQSRTGVRVALSRSTSTTDCAASVVTCYEMLSFVRGYDVPTISTNGKPQAGEVKLLPGTCTPYAYFTIGAGTCLVTVDAKVHFNDTGPALTRAVTRKVTVSLGGGTSLPMLTTDGLNYTLPITVSRATLKGPLPITMKWEQTSGKVDMGATNPESCNAIVNGNNANKCKGDLDNGITLQRTFVADQAGSGPIEHVELIDAETGLSPTNSVLRCTGGATTCTRSFHVRVGIKTLGAAGPTDPPTTLRPGDGGSQHATVDCDAISGTDLVHELQNRCGTAQFTLNTGQTCPTTNAGTPGPWSCVDVVTGLAANKIGRGMNKLILGSEKPASCTVPNTWPDVDVDSPRILPVFVVPLGAFDQPGSSYTVPVIRFVHFYITGWQGQGGGFDNPCQPPLGTDDAAPDAASIVGHFISYIEPTGSGSAGTELCELTAIDGCVAVMTR